MFHPNIDNRKQKSGKNDTNICLSLFDSDVWDKSHGLEGIVLGLLFLLHHPNLNDPLSRDISSCCECDDFAEGVKVYMETGEVWGNKYNIDFRVIDGKFVDLNKDKTGEDQAELDTETMTAIEPTNVDKITDISESNTNTLLTIPLIDTNVDDIDEVEEDIKPVRFFKAKLHDAADAPDDDDEEDDYGEGSDDEYFCIGFADEHEIKDDDTIMECETSEIVNINEEQNGLTHNGDEPTAEEINTACTIDNPGNTEKKETESRENGGYGNMIVNSTGSHCEDTVNQTNIHHTDSAAHDMVVDVSASEIEERCILGVRTRSLRTFDTVTEARFTSLMRRSVSTPVCLFLNASPNSLRQGIVS